MPRYNNVNFSGYCIPNMLKQHYPHKGGLRWLGVHSEMSVTHFSLGASAWKSRLMMFSGAGLISPI